MHFCEFLECIQKPEKSTEYIGAVVPGGCKPPCECCELNPGLLPEQ